MNLELTTRCPLHCPQCYVSLNNGREMPLDTALYWIRDAADAVVKQVNLSGGETLCYPHLTELIRECHKCGLDSNIALSGAYVTEEKLREFIDAGVTRIFVSLNGSTKEVNEKTLDDMRFPFETCPGDWRAEGEGRGKESPMPDLPEAKRGCKSRPPAP